MPLYFDKISAKNRFFTSLNGYTIDLINNEEFVFTSEIGLNITNNNVILTSQLSRQIKKEGQGISNVSISFVDENSATFNAQYGEGGMIYWAVYNSADVVKDWKEVLIGEGSYQFGKLTTTGVSTENINIVRLPNNKSLRIHYFAVDNSNNITSVDITNIFSTSSSIADSLATIWVDPVDQSRMTRNVDNYKRLISTYLTKGSVTDTLSSVTSESKRKARYNHEGLYFAGTQGYSSSSSSNYSFLHDGSEMYLCLSCYMFDRDKLMYLFDNTNGSSNNVGLRIWVDNSGANNARLRVIVGNGGTPRPLTYVGGDDTFVLDQWSTLEVIYNNTNYIIRVNGSEIYNAAAGGTHSTAQSTDDNNFGWNGTNIAVDTFEGYFGQFMAISGTVSGQDLTDVQSWIGNNKGISITPTNANVYTELGQSNIRGNADRANLQADLDTDVGLGFTMTEFDIAGIDTDTYIEKLEPDNNQIADPLSQFGINLRFGKEMFAIQNPVFDYKYVKGGTRLLNDDANTNNNWFPDGDVNQLLDQWIEGFLNYFLPEIEHTFRMTPVLRGLIFWLGETDATFASVSQSDFEDPLKNLINQIEIETVGAGYAVDKLRVSLMRIRDEWSSMDPTSVANIRTAIDAASTSFYIEYPSSDILSVRSVNTDTYTLQGDLLHHDANGINDAAIELFHYYKQYIDE